MSIQIDAFINETTRCFGAAPTVIIRRHGKMEMEMAYEQKDNSGSIWVNDRKEQDTHPDRTGTARIGGVDYWVNGWLRKTGEGKPYLSLSFKEKQPKPAASTKPRAEELDDAIPF
jgi:hypothetical protein